jgi:riboflavin kinase/FMN adenylyltransferase
MRVFYSLEDIARQSRPSAVTVGSFDGIHCAHKELLRRVLERARQKSMAAIAVTFDPHPAAVLAPDKAPKLLTTLPIKLELLAHSGIDSLLVLPFTVEFSRWSPEQFVEQVLVEALRAESVFVGENFRFGHRQAGNPALLTELGRRFGFRTEILEKVLARRRIVSSSQIRSLLEQGSITLANRLLGYPYYLRGAIRPGLGIGSTRTVPTLNLDAAAGLVPQRGVYITHARLGFTKSASGGADSLSNPMASVTNVGTRPTFGERELGVETHLLELWSGAQPSVLQVQFLFRLREERKFDSAEQLKGQILRDVSRAQAYFRRLRRAGISLV